MLVYRSSIYQFQIQYESKEYGPVMVFLIFFIHLFFFKSTIYYTVLVRSPWFLQHLVANYNLQLNVTCGPIPISYLLISH